MSSLKEVKLTGKVLSPGISVGHAFIHMDLLQSNHQYYDIDEVDGAKEYARVERAIQEVLSDLRDLSERVEDELNEELAGIFKVQEGILLDESVKERIRSAIGEELSNAEYVVHLVFRRLARQMSNHKNPVMRERDADFADLARRLIRSLKGVRAHELESLPAETILCANALLPSDTVFLPRRQIAGVIVHSGGLASHAAILTREMGVPAISGIDGIGEILCSGDTVILDGDAGHVIVNPDVDAVDEAKKAMKRHAEEVLEARAQAGEPAVTKSGETVSVLANISGDVDAMMADENGADGIGLFRMELFFMRQQTLPDVTDLLAVLRKTLAPVQDKCITIRLLDIGADKDLPCLDLPAEKNPMLGRRGIRLLHDFPDLFHSQLDALLQLSTEMNVRILAPMVTLAEEMEELRQRLTERARALSIETLPDLGAMIETPASALCIDSILDHCDFVSIGTNDLTQYTMVAGRENLSVDQYYNDQHPAVIRLIEEVAVAATRRQIPVEICGELASSEEVLPVLLTAGVRGLSVAPLRVPRVKSRIREVTLS